MKAIRSKKQLKKQLKKHWQLYVFLLPAIISYILFSYAPMYGIQIAFRNFKVSKGFWGSEWVGLKYFRDFFNSYYVGRLIWNTLILNIYGMIFIFSAPVIIAILLNRIRNKKWKRGIQTIIYVPNFISLVVLSGMLYIFLSPANGIVNVAIEALGFQSVDFMSSARAFRPIYTITSIWMGAGFSSMVYIAGLAGVDTNLYEAARLDGASIWQEIRHIDIPTLLPTVIIMLILSCGTMLSTNTDKTLLLQTSGNLSTSDLIGTYVYKSGIVGANYSYASAIGLFTNAVNMILMVIVNKISKMVSNNGIF